MHTCERIPSIYEKKKREDCLTCGSAIVNGYFCPSSERPIQKRKENNTYARAHTFVPNNNKILYVKANQRKSRHSNESKWRRVNTYAYLMVKGLFARP